MNNTLTDIIYGISIQDDTREFNVTLNKLLGLGYHGILIYDDADDHVITNNTIYDCMRGVRIEGTGSDNNLFYYNNFSGNSVYQAFAIASGNHFNTTVGGVPHGNYWDDIDATFQIFDLNSDGFGDYGVDWPYNQSNGGDVQGYVNDWGPMIKQNPPCVEPYAGMFINQSMTLCPGTYYMPELILYQGVINILGDNITLLCNQTVLVGNGSGKGITAIGLKWSDNIYNLTIKNCTLQNYTTGFDILNVNKSLIQYNTIENVDTSFGVNGMQIENITDLLLSDNIIRNLTSTSSVIGLSFSKLTTHVDVLNNDVYDIEGGPGAFDITIGVQLSAFSPEYHNSSMQFNNISDIKGGGTVLGLLSWFGLGDNDISNNIITDVNCTANCGTNAGLGLSDNTGVQTVTDNVIGGDGFDARGIYAERNDDTEFTKNNVTDADYGMVFLDSHDNNLHHFVLNSTRDLNISGDCTGNNISFVHFYNSGVNDSSTNNDYCINNEGNFYKWTIGVANMGHDDCGPANITIPNGGERYASIVPITFKKQSRMDMPPNVMQYYLHYSNDSGVNWYIIQFMSSWLDTVVVPWDVSDNNTYPDGKYLLKVTPNDFVENATIDISDAEFEINHTGPATFDNQTLDDRYWYVDMDPDIFVWTTEPNWNTTFWCNHSIYGPACTVFNSQETNETVVSIPGVPNAVTQKYLRHWHNNSDGISGDITSSNQINIVYGSYIEDSLLWNTTVENGSTIVGSDINDSIVDGCYIENSIIINSTVEVIAGAKNPCRIINSTIIDSHIMSSRVIDSFIDPTTIIDSIVINSSCTNCYIEYSELADTVFCGGFDMFAAIVIDTALTGGRVTYMNTDFYPLMSTDNICTGIPDVVITAPPGGSVVNGSVDVNYTSTENRTVEISIDGGAWAVTGSNITYAWDTSLLDDGTHLVQLRDVDPIGQYKYSNTIAVIVDNSPDPVLIIDPINGGVVFSNYSVQAQAADYVRRVEWYTSQGINTWSLDGNVAQVTTDTFGGDGWNGTWETDLFSEGVYNLTVTSFTRCYYLAACYNSVDSIEVFVDRNPPTGSITIIGSGGSTATSVFPNVVLDLTFSDAVEVDVCRYANNNTVDLGNAPWEPCVTNKAWVLRAGEGNRTVYYQIKDKAGYTQTYNDSIMVAFVQDLTPPSDPWVNDGLDEDVDWTNSDTTLSFNWGGSLEDVSQVGYMIQVLENGSVIAGWLDVGTNLSKVADVFSLVEGTNYSLEVKAYNSYGLESNTVTSDGAITDFQAPDEPKVNSSTHPVQGVAYGTNIAIFEFNATDLGLINSTSGIEGYSWVLDDWPGTAPDDILDSRPYQRYQEVLNNGYEQVLKENESGDAWAIQQEITGNLTANSTLRIKIALAEKREDTRDSMDYIFGVVDDPCAQYGGTCSSLGQFVFSAMDVKYAYTMDGAEVYEFEFIVNDSVTDGSFYVVIAGSLVDDDNQNNFSIAGTDDPNEVDNSTTTKLCNEDGTPCADDPTIEYAIGVDVLDSEGEPYTAQYDYLADGEYYFHVKAQDKAGNWGNTTHYHIIVKAGGVSVAIAEPVDNQLFVGSGEENISVKVFTSENASVRVVALHPDGSNYTSTWSDVDLMLIFGNITIEEGTNQIYAEAQSAGVITKSSSVYVQLQEDYGSLTNKTIRISHTSCSSSETNLCYGSTGGMIWGIGSESGTVSGTGYISDTDIDTIKIFATQQLDSSGKNQDLVDNTLLDEVHPFFGLKRPEGNYIIRNELRYEDLTIGGDFRVSPGAYRVYLRHNGVTADGRVNITLVIQ
ncbi:NosD domain-containing protein [Nanoarchaeota archaeon]